MGKNRIEFWLKDRHNVYMQLPVNPETVKYASPYGLNTVSIASLGDVAIPGERGLKAVSFSSFFPAQYNASYCECSDFPEPWEWVEKIEAWRDDRRNIRLIIAGTPISIPVFVDSFDLEPEKAGAPGDIYYSISLTEYRPIKAKQVVDSPAVGVKSSANQRPAAEKVVPKSHTVKSGDTLWKIAKEIYGDGAQYKKIYEANKAGIGKDPNAIKAGQKLVIP